MHKWTSKPYVPFDVLNMCIFHFGLSRNDCTKDENTTGEVRHHDGIRVCTKKSSESPH